MQRETVDRANEILDEISKLRFEIEMMFTRTSFLRKRRNKIIFKLFDKEENIEIRLSDDDSKALMDLRKRKIEELEKELEKL